MHDLPIQERLSKFLLTYRLTPHSATGIAPAELFMGHRPHSLLDNLRPDLSLKVGSRQVKQKLSHDNSKPICTFAVGEVVSAENFTGKSPKWSPGSMAEVTGPLPYVIQLQDGTTRRGHIGNIRSPVMFSNIPLIEDTSISGTNPLNTPASEPLTSAEILSDPIVTTSSNPIIATLSNSLQGDTGSNTSMLHRSTRICQPPDRYKPNLLINPN